MEDIPSKSFRDLETSLSEIEAERERFTRTALAKRSGVDESHVLVFLTELCNEGILTAKLRVRCPYCSQDHGLYDARSDVPEKEIHCFCGEQFNSQEKTNWSVIYEFLEDTDFFLTSNWSSIHS